MHPTDLATVDVAGALILRHLRVIKKRKGVSGQAVLFEHINSKRPKAARFSEGSFSEKDYYPFSLLLDLYEAEERVVSGDPKAGRRRLEHEIAQDMGVQTLFVKWVGTPALLAKEASKRWRLLHKCGELEVVEVVDDHGIIRVKDFFVHPEFCFGMEGFLEGLLGLTRENVVVKQTKCTAKGDEYCEFHMTWDV